MTDEQARDEAATEYAGGVSIGGWPSDRVDKYVGFKAGWQACLHGPAVTALVEAAYRVVNQMPSIDNYRAVEQAILQIKQSARCRVSKEVRVTYTCDVCGRVGDVGEKMTFSNIMVDGSDYTYCFHICDKCLPVGLQSGRSIFKDLWRRIVGADE